MGCEVTSHYPLNCNVTSGLCEISLSVPDKFHSRVFYALRGSHLLLDFSKGLVASISQDHLLKANCDYHVLIHFHSPLCRPITPKSSLQYISS